MPRSARRICPSGCLSVCLPSLVSPSAVRAARRSIYPSILQIYNDLVFHMKITSTEYTHKYLVLPLLDPGRPLALLVRSTWARYQSAKVCSYTTLHPVFPWHFRVGMWTARFESCISINVEQRLFCRTNSCGAREGRPSTQLSVECGVLMFNLSVRITRSESESQFVLKGNKSLSCKTMSQHQWGRLRFRTRYKHHET